MPNVDKPILRSVEMFRVTACAVCRKFLLAPEPRPALRVGAGVRLDDPDLELLTLPRLLALLPPKHITPNPYTHSSQ